MRERELNTMKERKWRLSAPIFPFARLRTTVAARTATGALVGVALLGGALLAVSGCGGSSGKASVQTGLGQLPQGNRVYAGESFNFTGFISNSKGRSPRYVVEKPEYEPDYNPTDPMSHVTRDFKSDADKPKAAGNNVESGTIDAVTGIYVAPKRLPDGSSVLKETVAVIEDGLYKDFLKQIDDNRIQLLNRVDPQFYRESETAYGLTKDDPAHPAFKKAPESRAEASRKTGPIDPNSPGGETYADLRRVWLARLAGTLGGVNEFKGAVNIINNLPGETLNSIVAGKNTLALRRLVAAIPSVRRDLKDTITFDITHKISADPATMDVSTRTSARLGDFITVVGDRILVTGAKPAESYPMDDSGVDAVRTYGASIAANRAAKDQLTFSIENPQEGAGGGLDGNLVYTAPHTLPRDASGNIVTVGERATDAEKQALKRRRQDIIKVTSRADPSQFVRITVNIVTGDAPSEITVN